ncbi:asparaginase [Altererythrobacter xixiisoli]|uniref:Asparaginase n=1 Tax=Croceibacterium xixiisoli TaxID=1476466 RepID=A0A6I4TYH3_9SPHN|nr:asparaginase [Croceibacterium xixiisoli]MXO99423.1 asparaginase [Croceibacterium xixiisoli]
MNAPSPQNPTSGRIRILATGGTIAGRATSAAGYRAGQIGVADLLAEARSLGLGDDVEGRDVASIGSQDIGLPQWRTLHDECLAALADPQVAGVVITHGTDTAEETALLLDLTLPAGKPVVLVGAMRPADALGADGMRNLANALQLARDPGAVGRGVLLVMGDKIFAARDARKRATQGAEAFDGFPHGALGAVSPVAVDWFGLPDRTGDGAAYALPAELPRVALLLAGAGMDGADVAGMTTRGAQGIVLAGMGQGNAPAAMLEALAQAAAAGLPVVRSTRVWDGLVDRNVEVDDDAAGFIAARGLNPAKSRILLQLLIGNGVTDRAQIQAEFDRL